MAAGGPRLGIDASGVYPVVDAVGCAIELIAESGCGLADLGGGLAGSATGASLAGVLAEIRLAYVDACLDLMEGATRLTELLDGTVRCYLSVDDEAAYRFGRGGGRCLDHPADLLPYIGDDPAELLGVARRLSDARTGLARAGDTLFDARTQLSTAWVGTSAAVADGQIRLVGSAAERAALRLDADHRALLCCADELTGVRAAIDDLRRRWPTDWIVPVAVNPAAEQTRADVLLDWAAQAERADSATQACRRRLTASITAGAEDGEQLGSALELDGLVADDAFRATDPVAQFAALGAAAQLLVASSAGAFPPPTATSPAGMAAAWTQSSAVQQEHRPACGPAWSVRSTGCRRWSATGRTGSCWPAASRTANRCSPRPRHPGTPRWSPNWSGS